MSTFLREYGVIVYWAAYTLLTLLPGRLHRAERRLSPEQMLDAYPQHRRLLDLWPRIKSGLTALLLVVIFSLWLSASYDRVITMHAVGLSYGMLLLLDTTFAWTTGILTLSGLRAQFVLTERWSWRCLLPLGLAIGFALVALALLLAAIS